MLLLEETRLAPMPIMNPNVESDGCQCMVLDLLSTGPIWIHMAPHGPIYVFEVRKQP